MKKIFVILIVCFILGHAYANEAQDDNSLTIIYEYNDNKIDGVNVELYKILNYEKYNDNFEINKIATNDLISIGKKESDSNGEIYYCDLEEGIYLILHKESKNSAYKYDFFKESIVSVPNYFEGENIKNVVCYPKIKPLSNNDSPKTGDGFSIYIYTIIIILSIVVLYYVSKKT